MKPWPGCHFCLRLESRRCQRAEQPDHAQSSLQWADSLGPIPSRPRDTVAFGFLYSNIGDPFQAIGVPLGSRLGSEEAIELNYAAHLTSHFLIQPVFQYYKDVGGNSHVPNAAVFGFRTQVNFRSRSGAL